MNKGRSSSCDDLSKRVTLLNATEISMTIYFIRHDNLSHYTGIYMLLLRVTSSCHSIQTEIDRSEKFIGVWERRLAKQLPALEEEAECGINGGGGAAGDLHSMDDIHNSTINSCYYIHSESKGT